jgi:phosphatidate phosphatase PAH1
VFSKGLSVLWRALFVPCVALCFACGSEDDDSASTGLPSCAASKVAIVTDIDETLTLSDGEFARQLTMEASYDPVARASGPELMQGYADRGFFILYLTARAEVWSLSTGETARDATDRWLTEHAFPRARSELVLAPDVVVGDATRAYKAGALQEREASGFSYQYAYGNAQTDIDAYADAGIAKERTYIIGPLAGGSGTVAIPGDGFTEHATDQLPRLAAVCR